MADDTKIIHVEGGIYARGRWTREIFEIRLNCIPHVRYKDATNQFDTALVGYIGSVVPVSQLLRSVDTLH